MQYPQDERRRSSIDALQVLATTASAAHRSSQLDNGDQISMTSHYNNTSGNNTANNSEDDESKTSRSSSSSSSREGAISKRTGLRKGKWSVSYI